MKSLDTKVGLAIGGAFALTYIVLVLFVKMDPYGGLIPAILVAGGVYLLAPGGPMGRRATPTHEEARHMAESRKLLEALSAKAKDMPRGKNEKARQAVGRVLEKANQIQTVIETDWNKFQAAHTFLTKVVQPMSDWMDGYFRIFGRDLAISKRALEQAEKTFLPHLEDSLTTLYERLHINDIAGIMSGNEVELQFPKIELTEEELAK